MNNTRSRTKPGSAETIARMAEQGNGVSQFFTNKGRMMATIQQEFSDGLISESRRKETGIPLAKVKADLIKSGRLRGYLHR